MSNSVSVQVYYFAYGSNLKQERMQRRITSARLEARGWVADYHVRFDKRGKDGTAKANLAHLVGARCWGVVYAIAASELPQLDRIEGGYFREPVMVVCDDGRQLSCTSYRSKRVDPRQQPAAWYVDCVIDGAVAHQLPAHYVGVLRSAAQAAQSAESADEDG